VVDALMQQLERAVTSAWYRGALWLWLLWPFSLLTSVVVARRRRRFLLHPPTPLSVPVVVVGGVTVGGSGKTPVVLALVKELQARDKRVGVVSRGYGGSPSREPREVHESTSAALVGDEPALIKRKTGVPVAVCRDRVRGAEYLISHYDIDIILSDDGMQHYRLPRNLEIAIVDGRRGLGNGRLLPMGPLREPPSRLSEVDFVLTRNSEDAEPSISYRSTGFRHHTTGQYMEIDQAVDKWSTQNVAAVTGLGQPEQFFDLLRSLGLTITTQSLRDHRPISFRMLENTDAQIVVITAKDAVKLPPAIDERIWILEIEAVVPDSLIEGVMAVIDSKG
jgi:tetraacyldisaccharide 4'-kinase